jgi:hypothetical protein
VLEAGDGVDTGLAEGAIDDSKFHREECLRLEDFVEKDTPFFGRADRGAFDQGDGL